MGISLSDMSNPDYQRNPVTGYFRLDDTNGYRI